jgi:hypothetical protein
MRIIKAPLQKEHAILRKGLRLVFQVATQDAMPRNRKAGCMGIMIEKKPIGGEQADFTGR